MKGGDTKLQAKLQTTNSESDASQFVAISHRHDVHFLGGTAK
jgi:hypothetical protein